MPAVDIHKDDSIIFEVHHKIAETSSRIGKVVDHAHTQNHVKGSERGAIHQVMRLELHVCDALEGSNLTRNAKRGVTDVDGEELCFLKNRRGFNQPMTGAGTRIENALAPQVIPVLHAED